MFCHCVHHLGECQDVRAHDEYREQDLAQSEELPAKGPEENFASIGQVMDMRMRCAELRDCVAGIRRNDPESDNEDDRSSFGQLLGVCRKRC